MATSNGKRPTPSVRKVNTVSRYLVTSHPSPVLLQSADLAVGRFLSIAVAKLAFSVSCARGHLHLLPSFSKVG